jgi:hypothetical protein
MRPACMSRMPFAAKKRQPGIGATNNEQRSRRLLWYHSPALLSRMNARSNQIKRDDQQIRGVFITPLLITCLLSIATVSFAQQKVSDAAAIAYTKHYLVSRIERDLPRVPFGVWFRALVGATTPITWEVNDCGEQSGTPADRGRDFPMCVEADAKQTPAFHISVSIMVGTFGRGIIGKPMVRGIFAGGTDGIGTEQKDLRSLRDYLKNRTAH